MKVLDPGHTYLLDTLDGDDPVELRFVKRLVVDGRTEKYSGVICQEVLRVLVDRVETLDREVPWSGNQEILKHLRMALVTFEARALIRKTQKEQIKPELIAVDKRDGHFALQEQTP